MDWKTLVLFPILLISGLGLFGLGMDADLDPWVSSDATGSLDFDGSTNLCCGGGAPPGCRATGPKSPLPASLHRRAQVR